MTASQKDGVVRIWSWGNETARKNDGISIEQVRQIYLRMANPQSNQITTNSAPRRRRAATSSKPTIQVNCDMATWTSDDLKVITSQCCLSSPNSADILPGSQIIYIWDSRNGHCLLGFPSAHEKACSVVIPHPFDSSLILSAGSDGIAKLWSLRTGKCLFHHHNKRQIILADASATEREKHSGFLDGCFSPDGLNVVLTDDTGSVTIIDTKAPNQEAETSTPSPPLWMKEQYFANDYYELFYDTNGYCIDRGSRCPPHLAPVAARCNHTGTPYNIAVQDAFLSLYGPGPICEEETRIHRDNIRSKSYHIRREGGVLVQNVQNTRTLIEAYPSVESHVTDSVAPYVNQALPILRNEEPSTPRSPTNQTSQREMSSRYRWIGYDDMIQDDDAGNDGLSENDENYDSDASRNRSRRRNGRVASGVSANNQNSHIDASPRRPARGNGRNTSRSRRRNNRNNNRREVERFEEIISNEPTRMSARQSSRRPDPQMYEDGDSDDSAFEQMLSTNTHPAGKYIFDYNDLGHTFKLPSGSKIKRKSLCRHHCVEGYIGQKAYAPQVGDNVVYIPRAHSDTLEAFPICNNSSIGAPWRSWQTNSPWPVVQCEVKAIRYRFPYSGYFGRNCE